MNNITFLFALIFVSITHSLVAAPPASGEAARTWQSLLQCAERLSCDISFTKNKAVWPSDSAKRLAQEALALVDTSAADADCARASILMCLGDYYLRDSSMAQADTLWTEAAKAVTRPELNATLLKRAITWRRMILESERGNIKAADSLKRLALGDSTEQAALANRATYLHELATIYTKLLRIDDNWRTHEQVVREWRANQQGDPHVVVIALMDLAEGTSKVLFTNVPSRYPSQDSAVRLGEEALDLVRNRLGRSDPMAGYVLNRLGDYYGRRGDAQMQVKCWREADRVNRLTRPADDIECQGSIDRLGNLAVANGEYAEAERLLTLGVELRKRTQGEGHQEVASLVSGLANLYRQMGQFAVAESLLQVALDIRKRALPANHPDIASSLNALGRVCFEQGRTADAEVYWLDALEMRRISLGADNTSTVSTLQNLATLYQGWGRNDEAEKMLRESIRAKKAYLGDSHPEVAHALLRLAELHSAAGKLAAATEEIETARSILAVHSDTLDVDILSAEAEVIAKAGRPDLADSLILIVLNRSETQFGPTSLQILTPLVRHAEACRDHGELAMAESLYQRAFAVAESNDVTQSSRMVDLLASYGDLREKYSRSDEALMLFARAYETALTGFLNAVQVLPEARAIHYGEQIRRLRDKCIASLFRHNEKLKRQGRPDVESQSPILVPPEVAAVVLNGMAVVSEVMIKRSQAQKQRKDDLTSPLIDSLYNTSLQLSRLYLENDLDTAFAGFDRRLKQLSERKLHLQEALARLSYRGSERVSGATLDQVEAANFLQQNPLLVEYVKFKDPDESTESRYAAFVSRRGTLLAVDLGPVQEIDALVEQLDRQMQHLSESGESADSAAFLEYLEIGGRLAQKTWGPIDSILPDSGRIMILPDGTLNLIAFGSLPWPREAFLTERYTISYLSSVGDLKRDHSSTRSTSRLLAIGDPDFTADSRGRVALFQGGLEQAEFRGFHRDITRDVTGHCHIQRDSIAPLVATRTEVESAGRIWRATHTDSAIVLLGRAASEENFKRLATGSKIVHIATHGYCLSSDCFSTSMADITRANPLLLSGLLLAGAGSTQASSSLVDDGVLSSEEIACLDLRGTRCVVLSACESGRGAVTDGEGVYGLRRAFQLAGAEDVISSLWAVPDQSTARLMRRLFQNVDGDVPRAVRAAQLAAIAELRAEGLPAHPYSWGAFIVVGN